MVVLCLANQAKLQANVLMSSVLYHLSDMFSCEPTKIIAAIWNEEMRISSNKFKYQIIGLDLNQKTNLDKLSQQSLAMQSFILSLVCELPCVASRFKIQNSYWYITSP
jgi:hypothetical protein